MKGVLRSAVAVVALVTTAQAFAATGDEVYKANCAICHNNLKPKLGDKSAWGPLIQQGEATLVAAVIHGKGAMPPRGGKPGLSDNDIKAAIEYIESKAK